MATREVILMLEAIGLDETDERVYLAVLAGTSEARLAEHTGIRQDRIAAALRRLVALRLLRQAAGGHAAVPPEIALPILIETRAQAVRQAQRTAAGLGAGPAANDTERVTETVPPAKAAGRLTELLEYATKDILLADANPHALPLDQAAHDTLARLAGRDVRIRAVTPIAASTSVAGQRRFVPAIPGSFALVDNLHAAVVLDEDPWPPGTLAIVYSTTLLRTLVAVGDALWRQGRPVTGGEVSGDVLSPEDAELLRMLAAGMKDEAIARRLGIGVRTASRRIAELFTLLGAQTRFQAGLQAYRQGLL